MRWLVEVTSLGKAEKDALHVDADSWQKALQLARSLRGEGEPMSGFSIELLEEGCRAVDPVSRLSYEVHRATGADDGRVASRPSAAPRPLASGSASPPPGAARSSSSPPPPNHTPPQVVVGGPAPIAPSPSRAEPAAVPSQIVFKREQDATEALPLTYREYVYVVPPGSSEAAAAALVQAQLELVRVSLERAPAGKLVNLAVFDATFTGKPTVPPLATISWKDWRGAALLTFPRQPGRAPVPVAVGTPSVASAPAPPAPTSALAPQTMRPVAAAAGPTVAATVNPFAPVPHPFVPVAPAPAASPAAPAAAPVPNPFAPAPAPLGAASAVFPLPVGAAVPSGLPPGFNPFAPVSAIPAAPTPAMIVAPVFAPSLAPVTTSVPQVGSYPLAAPAPVPASTSAAPAAGPSASAAPAAPAAVPAAGYLAVENFTPAASFASAHAPRAPSLAPLASPGHSSSGTPSKAPGRIHGEDLIADLFESMHDLHFSRDAVEGGDFCLTLAMEKIPSLAGIVQLYDIDRREFLVTSARGAGTSKLLLRRFPETDELLAAAMRRRRAVVIGDAAQNEAAQGERYTALGGAWSLIVAPVMQAGRFLGAIELLNPIDGEPFTESDGNAVTYIAEQLAEFVAARGIVTDPERISMRPTQH